MSGSGDELGATWQQVKTEVSSRDLLVFPGSLSLTGMNVSWPLNEAVAGFLDLAVSLGVRMVYMKSNALQAVDLIDAVVGFLSDVDYPIDADTPEAFMELAGVSSEPEVHTYLRQGREHYGHLQSVLLEWVHDGVAHRFERYAPWWGALIDKAGELAELIENAGAN